MPLELGLGLTMENSIDDLSFAPTILNWGVSGGSRTCYRNPDRLWGSRPRASLVTPSCTLPRP